MKPILKIFRTLLVSIALLGQANAAEKYTGTCNVVFEGDSTLHAFTGDITNVTVVVICDTNAAGVAVLNTRLEIAPKQLSTHHEKRDANMYKMFQSDRFPKLMAVVTNAPLAAAKLSPSETANVPGSLAMKLTFCGITKEVVARTTNPKPHPDSWEFDLQADISLKAFKLQPPSVMFGAISVDDKVVIKAHVKVQKETPKP
jgi:polyisoprenoid-binding protein YceI